MALRAILDGFSENFAADHFSLLRLEKMADDGLLLNFEAGDTPGTNLVSAQYKGRWKERALSKKWDRIKARRALNGFVRPATQPPTSSSTQVSEEKTTSSPTVHGSKANESIERAEERPLKRKRKHIVASSSNATPVGTRNFGSSSLFTSNPEITLSSVPKESRILTEMKEQIDSKARKVPNESREPKESEEPPIPSLPKTDPSVGATEFGSLGINPTICSHLHRSLQISEPTKIQTLAIPHLLTSTQDTFLRAHTGSGKTLAFLLPILHTILSLPTPTRKYDRTSGIFAIILTPTRELAKQTEHVLTTLTAGTWVVPGWLLGGERKKAEKARLRKGVNILVATPGRLVDHLETTMAFDTSATRWMVLDEGDKLVDMGFLDTVGKVLRIVEGRVQHSLMKMKKEGVVDPKLPGRLVKVLCSATLRGEEGLGALETIVSPVFLKAETEPVPQDDTDHVFTPGELTQKAVILPAKLRLVTLVGLLTLLSNRPCPAKMIIFLSCTTSVDYHHKLFSSFPLDLTLFQLHGTLEQPVRTATITDFSAMKSRAVLLATDVASRGLDLPDVDMIVQFDPPFNQDDYIHRIGRTARAGRKGEGILFLLPSEKEYLAALSSHGAQIERIPYEDILQKAFGNDWMNKATTHQLHAEKWVLQDQGVPTPFRTPPLASNCFTF